MIQTLNYQDMKKSIYTFITIVLFTLPVLSQKIGNLNGIYYQAVAIDEDGKEIVGLDIDNKPINAKTIGIRFTITKGLNGAIQWEETHETNTDKFGLFNLIIGKGKVTGKGAYAKMLDIPWIDADQFLKVEISTKNDGSYRVVSNQQFMTVPYSFYTDDIADNAITTDKILDSAILNRDIHTDAVDSRTILNESIQAEDIDTSAVTTSEIKDSTIINRDLATSSIDTRTISDSTIINRDIATGAVESRVLLDSSIINRDLGSNAVDTRVILDSTIVNIDIRSSAINSRTILDATILNEDIADTTIDLTSKVKGVLPTKNGGTGNTLFPANAFLIGNADSTAITSLGQAKDGQIPVGVTDSLPVFKVLAGKAGIKITQLADSVIISSGVGGIFIVEVDSLNIGDVPRLGTWTSDPIEVLGVNFGSIIHGALIGNIHGCLLTIYVIAPDTIQVTLFNSSSFDRNFGENNKVRMSVMN